MSEVMSDLLETIFYHSTVTEDYGPYDTILTILHKPHTIIMLLKGD